MCDADLMATQPEPEPLNDIERLIAGECLHGHPSIRDCLYCALTRLSVVATLNALSMRKSL